MSLKDYVGLGSGNRIPWFMMLVIIAVTIGSLRITTATFGGIWSTLAAVFSVFIALSIWALWSQREPDNS